MISGGGKNIAITGGYQFIGGGYNNYSCGNHSSILGGDSNQVLGNCSAIFGGSGNTVAAGYNYVGIFGQNINAAASNTFHVECLNACSTPPYTGLLPSGTVAYKNFSALAVGDRVLVIQP